MRYSRNHTMLTEEENESLHHKQVAIVGCGGLGGYCIEMLARIGLGHLVCIDGDEFDESNWNRQVLSSEDNLGKNKAEAAKERVTRINSTLLVTSHKQKLKDDNYQTFLQGCDLVIDAVDDSQTKIAIESYCRQLNIPMIHGAIGGWYGQVATIRPGDQLLEWWYHRHQKGIEKALGNPSFTPAMIASIQVSEAIKVLLSFENSLQEEMLLVDLNHNSFDVVELSHRDR